MPDEVNNVVDSANEEKSNKEVAERKAKDEAFAELQKELLARIGDVWKREESDRMEGWYVLSRDCSEYVANDLAHNGSGKKSFTSALRRLEVFLSDFTDDSRASVSRLLATQGLWELMQRELEEDAEPGADTESETDELMKGLTTSLLKSLVRLIDRQEDEPGLSYQWKEAALDKGPKLVADCATDSSMTIAKCKDAVDAILSPVAAVAEEDDSKTKSAKKEAARSAVSAISRAVDKAGKSGARTQTLTKLVADETIGAEDLRAMVAKSPAARIEIVQTISPEEVATVIRNWTEKQNWSAIQAIIGAASKAAKAMKAAQPATATATA